MDMLRMLDFTELFGGLSERSKKMLAEIAIPKRLQKGETLFHEGDKGFALYLMGHGSIQLVKSGPDTKEVVVKMIHPGEVFGEVILFEKDQYPVTATAVKDSTVFALPKHQFHCLLNDQSFRNDFIVLLMHKQRYLTERLMHFQSHSVEHRFYLVLKDQYGMKNQITPGMSKKEMAAAIGATPETLSRILANLKSSGMMVWEGGKILIKDEYWKNYGEEDQLMPSRRKND
jgi:CRP-like cAMP-binding protein